MRSYRRSRLTTPSRSEQIDVILDFYSELWRRYHNVRHILDCYTLFRQCNLKGFNPDEQAAIPLMLIYHDVILRLGREKGWSENKSASLCEEHLLAAGWPMQIVDLSTCGIRATITHSLDEVPAVWKKAVALMLDIDLMAGLGQTFEDFLERTRLVGEEFEPQYLPEEFRNGRRLWAASFAERSTIFHSPFFSQFEDRVKSNLRRYIAEH